jgi:hypothetical protein
MAGNTIVQQQSLQSKSKKRYRRDYGIYSRGEAERCGGKVGKRDGERPSFLSAVEIEEAATKPSSMFGHGRCVGFICGLCT